MKRYIWIFAALLGGLASCDYNARNFEGLDELSRPTNVAIYDYTVTDADITTIITALRATGDADDAAMAARLETDRIFSDLAPASVCIPRLLASKYTTVDLTSSANITYTNMIARSDLLTALSTPLYTLTEADYQLAWGSTTDYSNALTPEVPPATAIPAIFLADFPDSAEGDYKIVSYNYSAATPAAEYLSVNFEDNPAGAGSGTVVDLPGWLTTTSNASYFWQCRSYSGNLYAQASGLNNSGNSAELWMISPQINLSGTTAPGLSFDIVVGYYTSTCLSVRLSTDFDGTQPGIATATWTDITAGFELPTEPASGYSSWAAAGTVDLSSYVGQGVYVAFVYDGDDTVDPKRTTTYQLDNIRIAEPSTAAAPEVVYAAWGFDGTAWSAAGDDIVVLQPGDYTAMGFTYLGVSTAPNYLPAYLAQKFPYAQQEDARTVVFLSDNAGSNYADLYVYSGGAWAPSTTETLTSQFVYTVDGWVFDPTITYTMVAEDYMIVVQYVIDNLASQTPALVGQYGDAEYYYGFAAYYSNISLRETDRGRDPDYAALTTDEEKKAYFEERTIEGLGIFLRYKYPDATPQVSGIDVLAYVTCAIYDGVATDRGCTFLFQCVGANPSTWEFVEQTAGTVYW